MQKHELNMRYTVIWGKGLSFNVPENTSLLGSKTTSGGRPPAGPHGQGPPGQPASCGLPPSCGQIMSGKPINNEPRTH